MATVGELLAKKGAQVYQVSPNVTVLDATRAMNEHRVGGLVVTRAGQMVGVFTERDVLRRVVAEQRSPATTKVQEVMTTDVICCNPTTTIEEASRIMRDERVRHLPICDAQRHVVGLVSIGDINAFHAGVQDATIQLLNEYVSSW